MAALARSKASLRIFGDNLIPDEVSGLLGCVPTEAWTKGQVEHSGSGRAVVRKSGAWFLRVAEAEPENLNGHVAWLLYAGNSVAPLCRKQIGSIATKTDRDQLRLEGALAVARNLNGQFAELALE